MGGQWYDANISITGLRQEHAGLHHCDARLNRPALMIYGGTSNLAVTTARPWTSFPAFQSYGEFLSGNTR